MKKILLSSPQQTVSVCRYAPGERHRRHADEFSRISLVLRGGYCEEARVGTITMRPGEVLLKSRNAPHEDKFGATGATIVALEFHADDPFDSPDARELWRPRSDGVALRHATAFLEAAFNNDESSARIAGADLVADCCDHPPYRSHPDWIKRLTLELEQCSLADISIATRARDAGVHPAHASRLFRQCHGRSITEYAQAQSVRRALEGLVQLDQPLSQVAATAGFYDQSHMNRVFRRVIGRSPRQQRALIAAAS